MRNYPHHPDEARIAGNFQAAEQRLVRMDAMTPALLADRSARFWRLNAEAALECACIAHALEHDPATVHAYLKESSACFAEGLMQGAPFNLTDLSNQLSVAVILEEGALVDLVCSLPRERYASAGITYAESAHLAFEICTDIAAQRTASARARLILIGETLEREKLPRPLRGDIETGVVLERLIVEHDEAGLDRALIARSAQLASKFKNPQIRNMPSGLLDLWGVALACLAADAGLRGHADSPYLPLALVGER